ncbi:MAG TPA: hypothetical protein VK901_18660 [Nitrospiraceae bacterium]|nr:hypothetical protein [Nitrospiraceae bacterium]
MSAFLLGIVTQSRSAYRAANHYGGLMRYGVMMTVMILAYVNLGMAQVSAPIQRESLRYLPGVTLAIEEIETDAKADGLSEEAVHNAVERTLQSSGIPILTQVEGSKTPSKPFLYVRVATYKIESGLYAYAVTVALKQLVALAHRPQRKMSASTWEQGLIGEAGSRNIGQVTKTVEDLVKRFANDFLAVNAGDAVREEK